MLPLLTHVDYAPRAVLKLEKKMGQTDGQTPDRYITLNARRGQHNNGALSYIVLLVRHHRQPGRIIRAVWPMFARAFGLHLLVQRFVPLEIRPCMP